MSVNQVASEVRIAKSIGYRLVAKKAVRAILWLIVLAAVIYAIIAASMTRYVATNLGTLEIVSSNFPGGQAQKGAVVAVDLEGGYDDNPLKNLLTAVTPHSSVLIGKVVEGPYGSPDWKSYNLKRPSDSKLSNEYIFECVRGCKAGTYGIMRDDQIMGIPVER